MADPFVAEIRMFPFNFAPKGWAWCDGQLIPLSQNTALFALLGTTYGGNGQSNFALPDLQGRAVMHPEAGPGLSFHDLGEVGGEEQVTLLQSEMPIHTHGLSCSDEDGNRPSPAGAMLAVVKGDKPYLGQLASPSVAMAGSALTQTGGSQPHNNMMPYLTLYFCIALQGVYPPRS